MLEPQSKLGGADDHDCRYGNGQAACVYYAAPLSAVARAATSIPILSRPEFLLSNLMTDTAELVLRLSLPYVTEARRTVSCSRKAFEENI